MPPAGAGEAERDGDEVGVEVELELEGFVRSEEERTKTAESKELPVTFPVSGSTSSIERWKSAPFSKGMWVPKLTVALSLLLTFLAIV
jgi:hypothetical protein